MSKIYLHGALKEQFGEEYNLDVTSAPEACRALCFMKPGFREELMKYDYHIVVGNLSDGVNLDNDSLTFQTQRDIHFIPVLAGAGNGILKVVLAIALVAAAFIPGIGTLAQGALLNTGIAMGLAGISALLSPQAKTNSSGQHIFTGEDGTAVQGAAVPLVYGQIYCDLQLLSASITNASIGIGTNIGGNGWTQLTNTLLTAS